METQKDDLNENTEQTAEAQGSEEEPEFEVGSAAGNFNTDDMGKGSSAVEFEPEENESKD